MDLPVRPSGEAMYTLWDTLPTLGLSAGARTMRGMLRVALRPRSLGLLALMIAATVVCGLLATWQWHRAHRDQGEPAPTQQVAALSDVIGVGDPVTNEDVGRIVVARGGFDPAEQVIVPGRRIDGTDAVIVVTALHVTQADGTDARLPVARGWVPARDVMRADGAPDPAKVPRAPAGPVAVSGRLEAGESADSAIGPDGTARQIATTMLVNVWGSPMYAGYLAQTSAAPGLRPMPAATSAFSRGLDWQNVGYTFQWAAFGAFFLYLWWRTVRTRYLDEEAERAEAVRSRLARAQEHTEQSTHTKEDGSADYPAAR